MRYDQLALHYSNDVEAAFADGRLYLVIDPPRPLDAWRLSFVGADGYRRGGVAETMRLVHVISRPAHGECIGYVLTEDGALRLRLPNYAGEWPEMDAAVLARVDGAQKVVR